MKKYNLVHRKCNIHIHWTVSSHYKFYYIAFGMIKQPIQQEHRYMFRCLIVFRLLLRLLSVSEYINLIESLPYLFDLQFGLLAETYVSVNI